MNFYAYKPRPDGSAPVGTEGNWIIRDLKTIRGVRKRIEKVWKPGTYRLFTYTNFFDDSTFTEVK
jgi:hypothetical protein